MIKVVDANLYLFCFAFLF